MINTDTVSFQFAYHKGRWVKVPLLYLPDKKNLTGDQTPLDSASWQDYALAHSHMISNATEMISPKQLSQTELQELCKHNNIPYGWVTNQYKAHTPKKTWKKRPRMEENVYTSLTNADYAGFIKKLKRINKIDAVIAQILWYLNGKLARDNECLTREEILRLTIQDLDFSDDNFATITLISTLYQFKEKRVREFFPELVQSA